MISSYLGKNKTLYIFSFQPYSEHIEEAKTGVCCGCTTMVIATVVSQTPQITSTTLYYVTKQEALIQNTRKHTYSSLLDSPKANYMQLSRTNLSCKGILEQAKQCFLDSWRPPVRTIYSKAI